MSNFGKNLKQLRLERSLSQQELADILGISKSAISMYENGKREPAFDQLDAVAQYFHIGFHELLGSQEALTEASILAYGTDAQYRSWMLLDLFGHPDATCEQLAEVRNYARYIYARDKKS